MQSRSVTEAGTTRCDSRAPQRGALIGTFAADFPSGPAAKTPRMQAGHMKATVRTASAQKTLAQRGRPHMNQFAIPASLALSPRPILANGGSITCAGSQGWGAINQRDDIRLNR